MKKLNLSGLLLIVITIFLGQDCFTQSRTEIVLDFKDYEQLKSLFVRPGPSWFSQYGTVMVAVVALVGTVLTSIFSNRRSRLNTTAQILASETNLMAQLKANKDQETQKHQNEHEYKMKIELKELVAKFIKSASELNNELNSILYDTYDNGGYEQALSEYEDTLTIRRNLKDTFYSIKVTLDGSQKQAELEAILNEYMEVTCFKFDIKKTTSDQYEQPIGRLYHKMKGIVHQNYVEPILS